MRAALSPQATQTLATLPALRAFGEEDRDRLTALFQRGRFSHRPVDEEMRQRAIDAVEELEGEPGADE